MRSDYKKLGRYIRQVDERNSDLVSETVLGINIDKYFMPSVANIVGTDLRNYKLLRHGRFACNAMHVGRDKRLPVALYTEDIPSLVSPAYFMFEIVDENEITPEYLMLCFRQPDFDRMCWFKTDASVRGGITWDEICDLTIPVPPISEQRKIVHDYQVITERIELLNKINDKLKVLTCNLIARQTGSPILLNKSKAELNRLSKCYKICSIKDYCSNMSSGSTPSRDKTEYWKDGTIPWLKSGEVHNSCIFEVEELITKTALNNTSVKMKKSGSVVMAMYGATAAQVGFLCTDTTTNQAICTLECSSFDKSAYLFFSLILSQKDIFNQANGGAQDNLSKEMIEQFKMIVLSEETIQTLGLSRILNSIKYNTCELIKLKKLSELIISKMLKGA